MFENRLPIRKKTIADGNKLILPIVKGRFPPALKHTVTPPQSVQRKVPVGSTGLKLDPLDLQTTGFALLFLAEDNHLFYRAATAVWIGVHKGVW